MTTNPGGASGRITLELAASLPWQRFAACRKEDGVWARIVTDRSGAVAAVVSRNGLHFTMAEAGHIIGVQTGLPSAQLAAELDAHTEAGIAARTRRGYALAHLFDLLALDGRPTSHLPYAQRYGLLHRGQAIAEQSGRVGPTIDHRGDAHDAQGRYVENVPRDCRLLPIVELRRGRGAIAATYEQVIAEGGEGVVVVALDAPLGARRSKVKLKPTQELDAVVLASDRATAVCSWRSLRFTVGTTLQPTPGTVVEVAFDGWYGNGLNPRFPRVTRVRRDLQIGDGNGEALRRWAPNFGG